MRYVLCFSLCLATLFIMTGTSYSLPQAELKLKNLSEWDDSLPLPRYRLTNRPIDDPNQSLIPYVLSFKAPFGPPTSGLIDGAPEYEPVDGVIFRYHSSTWATVVKDMVVGLTKDPTKDEIAYVVVGGTYQKSHATNLFTTGGADMSKVVFIEKPSNTIWIRDFGPHFIWQSGAMAITDSHYYPTRGLDNFIPTLIGEDFFDVPVYPMGLYYSGGNFMPGPNRSGFVTSLITIDNPGFSTAYISQLYMTYQGIDTLHVMPKLPSTVDGTGHIDMWMYIVDQDSVIISEFVPGSHPTAIAVTNNAVTYMQNLGFTVHRPPAMVGYHPNGTSHFTYTNAFRVNDRIFIPSYGGGNPSHSTRDAQALATWKACAGPTVEIIQIPCYDIIWAAGAIHCTCMQVPRYTDPAPSAHVISPDGNELLVTGTDHELCWAATDDVEVTDVDLYYSVDGGVTFPNVIASNLPNDGEYNWTVPSSISTNAVVKVVATDASSNFDEAVSETVFEIDSALQHVYDFSTGAGVDKWGWGYQTTNWPTYINGKRHPVTLISEIETHSPGAYGKIATSNAIGNDFDPNRYISKKAGGAQESTHMFEFIIDEDPAKIKDIKILWEGYADDCQQMELYVWNDNVKNWGDGAGNTGENKYMEIFAGNRDDNLVGHIRENFDWYIDNDDKISILLYSERKNEESFHDYVAITVTYKENLVADTYTFSGSTGGTVNFTLNADPVNANRKYILMGSASGMTPGIPLPGGISTLPLKWDILTTIMLEYMNSAIFDKFMGSLDANGVATATLVAPPAPSAIGLDLYFAYGLSKPWDYVSIPVTINVGP